MAFGNLFRNTSTTMGRWYFPSGRNLEKTSASNAYVETFNDKKIESLAREICQNSLDASDGYGKPVRVSFDMIKIKAETVPGYKELIDTIIPKAESAWPHEVKTQKLIQKMKSILSKPEISVLKISDENTTGLEPQNWESLIEQAGSSVKSSDESGGSFGIGKAAPFAVSDLRMVFYNTLAKQGSEQSIGVTKFVSFDLPNGETTQGTGYFGENEKTPFNHGVSFDPSTRSKLGTDVYVIGFDINDFPDYKSEIMYSILDKFLFSIERNQLEVIVEGEVLNKDTISKYLSEIISDKRLEKTYIDLISYYGVLADKDHIVINMPEFEPYAIESGEAVLVLSNKTENNRRVLMTRKAGMKIFDKKSISGVLKFSGVFQATGPNINKVLKEIENPNHDKWSVDRASDKKRAKQFLDFVTKFIKKAVIDEYQEKITQEVDAFGVSDFLPSNLDALKGAKAEEKKPLVSGNAMIKIKNTSSDITSTTPIRSNETGELSDEELKKAGIVEGNSGGHGLDGGEGGGLGFGDNDFSGGDEAGHSSNDFEGDEMLVSDKISRKRIANMHYRVIESDSSEGKYRIVLNPEKNIRDVMISIAIIGDSGNKTKVKVKSAFNVNIGSLQAKANNVYVPNLVRGKWQAIDVKVNQYNRLKLEVEVYANFE